jgi:hypothetical protein
MFTPMKATTIIATTIIQVKPIFLLTTSTAYSARLK